MEECVMWRKKEGRVLGSEEGLRLRDGLYTLYILVQYTYPRCVTGFLKIPQSKKQVLSAPRNAIPTQSPRCQPGLLLWNMFHNTNCAINTYWLHLSVRNQEEPGWRKTTRMCEEETVTSVTGFGGIYLAVMMSPDQYVHRGCRQGDLAWDVCCALSCWVPCDFEANGFLFSDARLPWCLGEGGSCFV